MSNDYKKAIGSLEKFVVDDSNLTAEDIRKELADERVDVEAFLSRFRSTVRKGYQYQIKKAAEREQAESNANVRNLFGDLAAKRWEELQEIFKKVRSGVFGEELKGAALARCRNQIGDKVSESELRSWLEDISAAGGK
jgi:hypothetical protein